MSFAPAPSRSATGGIRPSRWFTLRDAPQASSSADDAPLDPPDPRSLEDDRDARELTEARMCLLRRLIDELGEFDRALLLLHLEERSYAEIGEILGLSSSNVGTRLGRIRQRMRRLVNDALSTSDPDNMPP